MVMALAGTGPEYVGGANGFPLLRGSKFDYRNNIPRKPRLWLQVVMDMA